jgi:hypothetical protein
MVRRVWLPVLVLLAALFLGGCDPFAYKRKAGLQVITNDINSSLFLDGEYLDKTPYINKEIKPGTYTLRIQPDDPTLSPYETTISLQKGLLSVVIWKPGKRPELSGGVIYEMEKLPSRSATELSLVTVPDNAIVTIDKQPKDFAPLLKTGIEPGPHEFEVSLPSYESQKHTINMVAGHKVSVTLKLAKNAVDGDSATAPSTSASPSTTAKPGTTATSSAQTRSAALTGPRVKIKPTGFFQNSQEVVRVREKPANSAKELGFAVVGSEYAYLKETQDGWHKISFEYI